MNYRTWLILILVYFAIAAGIAAIAYFLGYILLQMPIKLVIAIAVLILIAFTIGIAITLITSSKKHLKE